ncbi:MAG: peptidoglycan-binding domain-containing protein [Candidatus Omnitrophota bacterium]
MKKVVFAVCGLVGIICLAGCVTAKSGSSASLESRVQALESKVGMLETDTSSSGSASILSGSEMTEKGVSADTMTKKQIQKALKNAGYYDGIVDGKIGPKTRAAIMEFQNNMELKADGIAGRNTKEKLLKYLQ